MTRTQAAATPELVSALVQTEELAAAYLYGSAARNETTPLSDIDLALVLRCDLDSHQRTLLLREITTRVERELKGARCDVRILDELPAAVAGRAVGEGVLLFETDPERRVAAEVRARMLYHDFVPFERQGVREGLLSLRDHFDRG